MIRDRRHCDRARQEGADIGDTGGTRSVRPSEPADASGAAEATLSEGRASSESRGQDKHEAQAVPQEDN